MFCKKGALRNFAKLTGKHFCQSLFLNKVTGLRVCTFIKKRLWCFPLNIAKFLRRPFIIEHLWWLLLLKKNLTGQTFTEFVGSMLADIPKLFLSQVFWLDKVAKLFK